VFLKTIGLNWLSRRIFGSFAFSKDLRRANDNMAINIMVERNLQGKSGDCYQKERQSNT